MKIESLFPTAVAIDQLPRSVNFEEKEFCKSLEMRGNIANQTSKDTYVLKHPVMKDIENFINQRVQAYFNEIYNPKDNIQIYITQSWINHTREGEQHHVHSHPNSILSGVFYIDADKLCDKITFIKTHTSEIYIDPKNYHTFNSNAWYYDVGEGTLVIFPSLVKHSVGPVPPSPNRNVRISLAFNTFIKGHLCPGEELAEVFL